MLHQGKTLLTKVISIEETKPIGLVIDEGMWDLTWEWESEGMWGNADSRHSLFFCGRTHQKCFSISH